MNKELSKFGENSMITVKIQCSIRKENDDTEVKQAAWYSFNIQHFGATAIASGKLAFNLQDYFAECLESDYGVKVVALEILSDPIFTIS